MKIFTILVLLGVFPLAPMYAQDNFFFPMHNIIRGDSVYNTFDKQVELVKNAGYDGLEINQVESFEGMFSALKKQQFPGAFFYIKVKMEPPYLDSRLQGYIRQLKGSNVILAPFIVSESKQFTSPSAEGDALAAKLIGQLGEWAEQSGLQVAIYPHLYDYVEKTGHAVAIAKKTGRQNVGLTFNLCHWLATTSAEERTGLQSELAALLPYLKMTTINGANDVVTQKQNPWDDYILPLGTGSFDTYGLVKYLLIDLKFKGPVGIQCFSIKGDKHALVRNTIAVWEQYKKRLEGEG